jgi:hypothetical protein
MKMAPQGALDQLGHALSCIMHAFAKADDNNKIFMAKWDINDGFWRMDCEAGEEYNFAYVLLQEEGMPITLVFPTLLQMGWVELPLTSVRLLRRQGILHPTIVIPLSGVSPIKNLSSM